jgi:serine/threonine protein kinase
LWKITDFGITSEATSKRAITSHQGRGTDAYLAPEMIGDSGRYTTKVDIWALGCILYELINREKAFKNVWAVLEHDKSAMSMEIGVDESPQILRSHLSELVGELLHRNPEQRPQIADVCLIFKSYCTSFHQLSVECVDDIEFIPNYPRWRALAVKCGGERELVSGLAEIYEFEGHETKAMTILEELVCRNPDDEKTHHSLEMLYERKGDWNIAIAGWRNLLEKHPSSDKLLGQLMKACEKKGAREKTDERKIEMIIEALKEMVDRRPNVVGLRYELSRALRQSGKSDLAIAVWAELVDTHSGIQCLQVQLSRACKVKGDKDGTIAVWKELVCKHPESSILQGRLRRELNGKENANDEWNRLKEIYPAIGEFHKRSLCILI